MPLKFTKLQRIAGIIAVTTALMGCATAAEQACQSGQAMAGYTAAETCIYATAERAQINSEMAAAFSVAATGLATYAVVREATEPRYSYATVMPFGQGYIVNQYGE